MSFETVTCPVTDGPCAAIDCVSGNKACAAPLSTLIKHDDNIDLDENDDLSQISINHPKMVDIERVNAKCFWTKTHRDGQPDIVVIFTARVDENGQPFLDAAWYEET